MEEVIIIEDDKILIPSLKRLIPKEISCELVETSMALKNALEDNPNINFFLLDDQVPPDTNEKIDYHFIENAELILQNKPEAKIWYT
jgi:hypothetical protein